MEVFRLSRKEFAGELSGKGAAIRGARWNPTGVEMIYAAANCSLAMAEVAVHFTLAALPGDFLMLTIHVPEHLSRQRLNVEDLPDGWNAFPHTRKTQLIGDRFVSEGKACLLEVPSVVVRGDYNWLINPAHKEAREIKIVGAEPFPLDARIFR